MKSLWKSLGTMAFWIGWPLIYLYLRFSRRTRLIVVSKDQALLVKNWLAPNEWSLPGGGMRLGEKPAAAAARELKEETGLVISPDQLKPLQQKQSTAHGLRFFYHCFLVDLKAAEDIKKRSLDITDAAWFSKENLIKQRLAPDTQNILRDSW